MQRSQNELNAKVIVKELNCSKNLSISNCTDLIINFQTFKTRRHYQQAKSDFHKIVLAVLKHFFQSS